MLIIHKKRLGGCWLFISGFNRFLAVGTPRWFRGAPSGAPSIKTTGQIIIAQIWWNMMKYYGIWWNMAYIWIMNIILPPFFFILSTPCTPKKRSHWCGGATSNLLIKLCFLGGVKNILGKAFFSHSKPPKIGTISEDLRESSVLSVWLIFVHLSTLNERCLNLLKQYYKRKCLLFYCLVFEFKWRPWGLWTAILWGWFKCYIGLSR